MRTVSGVFPALVLAFFAGCQSPEVPEHARLPGPRSPAERSGADSTDRSIYAVSNGWHTGIVLARSHLPNDVLPETGDFPGAEYFEFSWGDAKYFPAPVKGLGMAVSALLTPTPAVLHLAGLPSHPRQTFPGAETVEIEVTSEGFHKLVAFLDDSFDRDEAAPGVAGLYRFSRFYPATGRFHLFNTCNTWTARGLAAAGVPVTVNGTMRAEDLMAQLRP